MYDVRKLMAGRDVKPLMNLENEADFPRNEEVPEGCIVLESPQCWGYHVRVHENVLYAERKEKDKDGNEITVPLHLMIFEPEFKRDAVYTEKRAQDRWPCVVYIQGSAFHAQDMFNNLARHLRLAERGYVVALAQYRPSEIHPFPAQCEDAKTAVRFMRMMAERYFIDPDRIAVAGDSSGAHTALMAGFTGDEAPDTDLYSEYSSKVSCIVSSYAPTVFPLMSYVDGTQDHIQPDSPEGFEIGYKNVLENIDLAMQASPLTYLSEDKAVPPTLMIHGGRDNLVNFDQAVQLYTYMRSLKKDVTLVKINDAGHGTNGFDSDVIINLVDDFLKKHI